MKTIIFYLSVILLFSSVCHGNTVYSHSSCEFDLDSELYQGSSVVLVPSPKFWSWKEKKRRTLSLSKPWLYKGVAIIKLSENLRSAVSPMSIVSGDDFKGDGINVIIFDKKGRAHLGNQEVKTLESNHNYEQARHRQSQNGYDRRKVLPSRIDQSTTQHPNVKVIVYSGEVARSLYKTTKDSKGSKHVSCARWTAEGRTYPNYGCYSLVSSGNQTFLDLTEVKLKDYFHSLKYAENNVDISIYDPIGAPSIFLNTGREKDKVDQNEDIDDEF